MSNSGILITWPQLLYLGILFLSFYIVELVFFWLRHGRSKDRQQVETLQQEIHELQHELGAIKVRLAALAAQWLGQDEANSAREFSPALTAGDNAETPYARAIRLAKSGVEASELVSICAISRGEADLIVAIYRGATRD